LIHTRGVTADPRKGPEGPCRQTAMGSIGEIRNQGRICERAAFSVLSGRPVER